MLGKTAAFLALLALPALGQVVLQTTQPFGVHAAHMAPVGDVNGDGAADVVVSAPLAAQIAIFSGADGTSLVPWGLPNAVFDGVVAPAGDVNGDGIPDVLVGEGEASLNYPMADVEVRSGANGNLLATIAQFQFFCGFGYRVAKVGDLDGDGSDDYAISAPLGSTNGLIQNGSVRLHSGSNGGFIDSVDGLSSNELLGAAVVSTGDVNGDGTPDFATASVSGGGTVRLHSGADRSVLATQILGGAAINGVLGLFQDGIELAAGGDIDGDGVGDVVVGKEIHAANGAGAGLVRALSGVGLTVLTSIDGNPGEGLGRDVGLGDMNGDGLHDVVAVGGSPAAATVYSGLTGQVIWSTAPTVPGVVQAAVLGDADLDGDDDLVVRLEPTAPTNPGALVILAGGPWLGDAADPGAAANGTTLDLLSVNASTGGAERRVDIATGAPITISLGQPSTNPQPAEFAVFGMFGVPAEDFVFAPGLGIGDLCLVPAPVLPGAQPLFTLATSLPWLGGALVQAPAGAWSLNVPGLGGAFDFTLQAVVEEAAGVFEKTNGVIVRVK